MRVISTGVCCLYGVGAWKFYHKGSFVLGLSGRHATTRGSENLLREKIIKNIWREGTTCIKITSRMGQTILLALEIMRVLPREGL